MKNKIILHAAVNALGTAAYIALVALFLNNVVPRFDEMNVSVVLGITMMLMTLVFSVALVGSLLFGRPVLWYLDGHKKESIQLLISTLAIFFLIAVLVFTIVLLSIPQTL